MANFNNASVVENDQTLFEVDDNFIDSSDSVSIQSNGGLTTINWNEDEQRLLEDDEECIDAPIINDAEHATYSLSSDELVESFQ